MVKPRSYTPGVPTVVVEGMSPAQKCELWAVQFLQMALALAYEGKYVGKDEGKRIGLELSGKVEAAKQNGSPASMLAAYKEVVGKLHSLYQREAKS